MKDSYLTISEPISGIYKSKGSKFISLAYPVISEEDVVIILKNIKKEYHDARHHCYAWKLAYNEDSFRSYDDGEPHGTAGKWILNQIYSKNLSDILIVVVRYFGGILLGTGGLSNAYKMAAANVLQNAHIIERHLLDEYSINYGYNDLKFVMKTLEDFKAEPYDQQFDIHCNMKVRVRRSLSDRFIKVFENNKRDVIKIRMLSPK